MIDGQKIFDQPIRNNVITYDNIRKTATGQGYDCPCLFDCPTVLVCWTIFISKTIIR